jgi:hypothetical protein
MPKLLSGDGGLAAEVAYVDDLDFDCSTVWGGV